ncbi:hypothetical protein [Deinococcus sp.]|uniref:hypothetical protein n=1 Tax=Deinococcus sp. TaxID=47478 RepID=UPI003CC58838
MKKQAQQVHEATGLLVTEVTIHRLFDQLGITLKKTVIAAEPDAEERRQSVNDIQVLSYSSRN